MNVAELDEEAAVREGRIGGGAEPARGPLEPRAERPNHSAGGNALKLYSRCVTPFIESVTVYKGVLASVTVFKGVLGTVKCI